jgi:hypothetical protein
MPPSVDTLSQNVAHQLVAYVDAMLIYRCSLAIRIDPSFKAVFRHSFFYVLVFDTTQVLVLLSSVTPPVMALGE